MTELFLNLPNDATEAEVLALLAAKGGSSGPLGHPAGLADLCSRFLVSRPDAAVSQSQSPSSSGRFLVVPVLSSHQHL